MEERERRVLIRIFHSGIIFLFIAPGLLVELISDGWILSIYRQSFKVRYVYKFRNFVYRVIIPPGNILHDVSTCPVKDTTWAPNLLLMKSILTVCLLLTKGTT